MTDQTPDPASAEARIAACGHGWHFGGPCPDAPKEAEMLAKALKLLEALAEPHYSQEDHSWRKCRSCLAAMQFQIDHDDSARELVREVLAHVATLTEQLTSANARFCDQHRGIYRTSGCVVCGLMAAAVELRESEAKVATLTEQRDQARRLSVSYARVLGSTIAPNAEDLTCSGCGGPHAYDTSVPSAVWNQVIRANGLTEHLCLSCIVRAFALAGRSFTATLWSNEFNGLPLEVRVCGDAATDVLAVQDENNALRVELHRRALEQMDTETARANGLGEINQQLGARVRELEDRCRRFAADYQQWADDDAGGYSGLIEIAGDFAIVVLAALAAVRAPEPPQEPQP